MHYFFHAYFAPYFGGYLISGIAPNIRFKWLLKIENLFFIVLVYIIRTRKKNIFLVDNHIRDSNPYQCASLQWFT